MFSEYNDLLNSKAKSESSSPGSSTDTDASGAQSPDPTPVRPTRPPQPNVAVITMYDKELGESAIHQHKRQKKSPTKKKQKSLSVQVCTELSSDLNVQYFLELLL